MPRRLLHRPNLSARVTCHPCPRLPFRHRHRSFVQTPQSRRPLRETRKLASPYLGDCNYDGAGMTLQTLYDFKSFSFSDSNNLFRFDQTSFYSGEVNNIFDECHLSPRF